MKRIRSGYKENQLDEDEEPIPYSSDEDDDSINLATIDLGNGIATNDRRGSDSSVDSSLKAMTPIIVVSTVENS